MRPARVSDDLLLDSEASLRMADGLLTDLRSGAATVRIDALAGNSSPLAAMPEVLLRAYEEVTAMLNSLRQCRSTLERTTVARLHRTQEKLREVSTATETAASDMLDGLDRALAILDQLEKEAGTPDAESGGQAAPHQRMRDELHQLVSCLQFQDITSQQLSYASNVLDEVESRMAQLASLLDSSSVDLHPDPAEPVLPATRPFDPAASTQNADVRQAVADEIFLFAPPKAPHDS